MGPSCHPSTILLPSGINQYRHSNRHHLDPQSPTWHIRAYLKCHFHQNHVFDPQYLAYRNLVYHHYNLMYHHFLEGFGIVHNF